MQAFADAAGFDVLEQISIEEIGVPLVLIWSTYEVDQIEARLQRDGILKGVPRKTVTTQSQLPF